MKVITYVLLYLLLFVICQFIAHSSSPCSVWGKERYRCSSDNIGR